MLISITERFDHFLIKVFNIKKKKEKKNKVEVGWNGIRP